MKGKKKLLLLAGVLLLAMLLVAGCGGSTDNQSTDKQPADENNASTGENDATKDEPLKVGFIYIGPVGDAGWTYAQDLGRQYLEENMNVETTFIENVPENADAERALTQLAEQGNKLIFATSFGYMDYVQNVAKKYPDVIFMHCSGFKTQDNAGTYFGRMYQPRYLTGILAGEMTESNTIGYVAAHPIPEVIRGINAFTLGVRSVNPDAVVKVVWTNTWYDPATEKEAAKSLLESGADVIAQHQDTPGPQQAAQEAGAYAIGYNADMRQFAPQATLTSPVWNWGPYMLEVAQGVQDGTWKNDQYWGGLEDNVVDVGPFNEDLVSKELQDEILAQKQDMIDGKVSVFAGPIKDQSGAVKIADGEVMSDGDMLSLDWFVEGVEGTIPQ